MAPNFFWHRCIFIRNMHFHVGFFVRCIAVVAALLLVGSAPVRGQTNLAIYSDALANGFQDWSWGVHSLSSASPVHSGTNAVSFSGTAWQAISFWHSDFNPVPYTNLNFWANGGATGGQIVQIYLQFGTNSAAAYQLPALPTNSWRQFIIPFSTLNVANLTNLNRLNFQLTSYGSTSAFYLDDVNLTAIPPAPVHLEVNASQTLRPADARWFGLNTAIWDNNFDTPTTSTALKEAGTLILRFPGGSLSDEYHWGTGRSGTNTWAWGTSFANFIHIATNVGAQAMITVNYGTGTSNEAAAWVRSANLTNHLGFKYWEIGNECYGAWETDSNTYPHDPYTYAVRAHNYILQMKTADPGDNIKIGVVAAPGENSYSNVYSLNHPAINPRTGATNYGWTPILLSTLKSLGVTPDFLIHHVYPEWNSDSDQSLLLAAANWAGDAADLRQQISDYFGAGGTNIELLCTENNSDSGNQGKQSTSIVNGLYLADSLAQLTKTEFNGFTWWDLRNGSDTNGDFSASLYGWRTNGDLGIIGGLNTRYPTFYTFKLMQFFARAGDTVLDASSDYALLPAYAARKADGSLAVLVLNKDNATTFNAQLTLANFMPWTSVLARSFGIAQDQAARTNGPAAAQDIATNTLAIAGPSFSAAFPPYSATLLTFAPAAAQLRLLSAAAGQFAFEIQGQPSVPYVIQTSTNLTAWTSISTNTLSGSTLSFTNLMMPNSPPTFWRTFWQP
jgi:alpha-N-arabinofuranosidase